MKQPTEHTKGNDYLRRGKYKGEVSFENVSYSYPNQDGLALEEITFLIKKGERIGIVGRVGSGKTTIGKLVTKLFPPKTGKILIDGVDISQLDPSEIRENIGYVSQDPWLIAGTVEQNISFGATEIKTEQMIEAADVSTSSDFINAHNKGFKQMLDERGEGLSGGQKQAITIARAIVKKPPILILDEPTSSMDAKTEKNFIDRFKKYNAEATILLITHRTSLLSLVDKVIVVDKGKIVGSGSVAAFFKATKSEKDSKVSSKKTKIESVVGI